MLKNNLAKVKTNLKSGLTVGLVSIPLSISLALASGVTPAMGIISAFWGGFIAPMFAGSIFNIIGPTGALSGIILTFILQNGMGLAATLTILTGVIILLAWALNLQKYIIYIPSSVIHGFTLGVAFIIALGQLNNAFGLTPAHAHEHASMNFVESFLALPGLHLPSAILFVLALSFLIFMKKKQPTFPSSLLLVAVGVILGLLGNASLLPFEFTTLFTKFGQLSLSLFNFSLPVFKFDKGLFNAASVIAFIAIIETLLSGKIADSMTATKFKRKKEILALGLANIGSGIMGGIPVTAALARTSLNIKSGANSRTSAIISAFTIGLISILLFSYFSYLPLPIIAAVLFGVAIGMVDVHHYKLLWRLEKSAFFISIGVAVITVAFDPIMGVLLGAVITLLIQLDRMSQGDYEILLNKNKKLTGRIVGDGLKKFKKGYDPVVYSFSGNLTYINSQAHINRFENVAPHTHNIILRMRSVAYIDPDGLAMLEEIISDLKRQKKEVFISGISDHLIPYFEKSHFYKDFVKHKRIFTKTSEVLDFIYSNKVE